MRRLVRVRGARGEQRPRDQAEGEQPVHQPEEELATEESAEPEAQKETQAADDDEDDIDSFFV